MSKKPRASGIEAMIEQELKDIKNTADLKVTERLSWVGHAIKFFQVKTRAEHPEWGAALGGDDE